MRKLADFAIAVVSARDSQLSKGHIMCLGKRVAYPLVAAATTNNADSTLDAPTVCTDCSKLGASHESHTGDILHDMPIGINEGNMILMALDASFQEIQNSLPAIAGAKYSSGAELDEYKCVKTWLEHLRTAYITGCQEPDELVKSKVIEVFDIVIHAVKRLLWKTRTSPSALAHRAIDKIKEVTHH